MRIEEYFDSIKSAVDNCSVIRSSNLNYDKRATYEGFIRGELYFIDDSILSFREFIDVEVTIERLMYVYQYMNPSKSLIFRYDNSGHHKELDLSTYPHHRHEGSEENVLASPAPDLATVLNEVETMTQIL